MPIAVICSCGKTFSVRNELSGKRGRCPACRSVVVVVVVVVVPSPDEPLEFTPVESDPPSFEAVELKEQSASPSPFASEGSTSSSAIRRAEPKRTGARKIGVGKKANADVKKVAPKRMSGVVLALIAGAGVSNKDSRLLLVVPVLRR